MIQLGHYYIILYCIYLGISEGIVQCIPWEKAGVIIDAVQSYFHSSYGTRAIKLTQRTPQALDQSEVEGSSPLEDVLVCWIRVDF